MDKLLKEVLMIDELSIVETAKVNPSVEMDNVEAGVVTFRETNFFECWVLLRDLYSREKWEAILGIQRTVICYNCKGEGHMSRQCTKPKRKRDDSWFKEKVLLVQAQAHGQILNEEELAFLADPDILPHPPKVKDTDYALAEVHNHDNMNNNVAHQAVQVMPSSQQSNVVNHSETEITSDSNIIPYSQYVIESQQVTIQNSNSSAQQDDLILSVIKQLKTQVANCTKTNLENKSVNDTLTAELERYKEQVKVLKEG
ncbi:integrase, catalytic region, zinc finger, CCHC-type containing protein [Tanacetum coccineum]|uniref:Integrase, catalytic region, zinc finger, CCHC-type containing protein n=1 Tax=Tanacetum coccineum TaxID=301880 RepID=A0ABQ5AEQ5_9ASTR